MPQPTFRGFLRALADEVDAVAGAAGRDTMLRNTGHRMARQMPLTPVASMDALELEMNEALGGMGWGRASLVLNEAERALVITHANLPPVGSAGDPPGMWLSAVLEGLFEGWMAQQPGGDPAMTARRQAVGGDAVVLRYGK